LPHELLAANGDLDVSGPTQLAALVRAVAAAHRERDTPMLLAALRDVGCAADSWAAQIERHAHAAQMPNPFAVEAEAAAGVDRRTRLARQRVEQGTKRSGRVACPRHPSLNSGEAVSARVLA
jgi:hypothetical protein